jgi:hypothetical protein
MESRVGFEQAEAICVPRRCRRWHPREGGLLEGPLLDPLDLFGDVLDRPGLVALENERFHAGSNRGENLAVEER